MSDLRNQEPAAGEKEILVAGDPEKRHMKKCDELGGIPYHVNQIRFAVSLDMMQKDKLKIFTFSFYRMK